MATKQSEGKPSLGSIVLVVVLFGSIAVLALMPVELLQAVRAREQQQIVGWLGDEVDQWIMEQILDALTWLNTEVGLLGEQAAVTGNKKIDVWAVQRIHAASIWAHVIFYRMGVLLMWAAFALPCMAAAFIDAHYQRQISKASFTSQSPRLHKSGMDLSKIALVVLVAWMFVPIYLSILIAPISIATISLAWWLWVANMQKRL